MSLSDSIKSAKFKQIPVTEREGNIMRKKIKKLVSLITACVALTALCACGEPAKEEITVTFMNGEETLGTVTATAGEAVTGYEAYETVEDAEFLGWFETPTFLETSKKDLTTATFDADTTLYGSFKSTAVAEDTRAWYVVGAGSGEVIANSAWAGADVDDAAKAACQLMPTGNAVNEFAITIDLFAGDQFQVIHDWAWDGQKGFGCFTEIDTTQMENGGGLGGSDETSNINVIMDGNYTITLTTDPDNSLQDTLTIVRNGDPAAAPAPVVEEEETAYVVSDATGIVVKGSWVSDWSENKDLTREEGTNLFSITMDLDAGIELYFMVFENGEDTGLGMNAESVVDDASKALLEEAYNIKVAETGTYTFTVDADTMTITVAK